MTTSAEARGYKPRYKLLIGLLSLASGVYAALFYATEAMSERDFSVIADPRLRVGYCMVSNTSNPEKYLLAETTVRSPYFKLSSVVMPHALRGEITEEKKAALLALKERDELRLRAVTLSFRVADYCGYRDVAWPPETTPLDISLKWLQHDSTFLFFLERVRAEPDAADRVYDALDRSKAKAPAAKS